MSADFWAGYVSGAAGILIGNPLDIVKVRLQAGGGDVSLNPSLVAGTRKFSSLVRGWNSSVVCIGDQMRIDAD
jgi:solute carrier family 25 (mitochondrial carnitine/acylcarnitine transporter), member 20/29